MFQVWLQAPGPRSIRSLDSSFSPRMRFISWPHLQHCSLNGIEEKHGLAHSGIVAYVGPGPATSLDGTNVVFGKVLEGMDTVAKVAGTPSMPPFLRPNVPIDALKTANTCMLGHFTMLLGKR